MAGESASGSISIGTPSIDGSSPAAMIGSMSTYAGAVLNAAASAMGQGQLALGNLVQINTENLSNSFPTYGDIGRSLQAPPPFSASGLGFEFNTGGLGNILGEAPSVGFLPPIYTPSFGGAPDKPRATLPFNEPPLPTTTIGSVPSIATFSDPELPTGAPGAVPTIAEYSPPDQPIDRTNPELLSGVPTMGAIVIPPAPELSMAGITPPTITPIVIPDAPIYSPPEFLGVRPDAAPDAPTGLDIALRTNYSDINPVMREVLDSQFDIWMDRYFPNLRNGIEAIETRLDKYLQGGTALPVHIEQAIYQRTQDRLNDESTRASRTAWTQAAKAGYTMPPLALINTQKDIDQNRRASNARSAIDIAIKMSELEQANLQFAVTQSISLRQAALGAGMQYFQGMVQVNGQALEYARSVVDSVVKAYDIAARHAEIQARLYEAETRVYEARLRGAMAEIEAYTAQVNALNAVAQVDVAKASVYRAQIEGLTVEANLYRAKIEGVQAQASIEKLKVDVYQAKVAAYGAQVNAYTAQWSGYEAATRGEMNKVSASAEAVKGFQAEVEAWVAKWRGFEAQINGQKAKIEASAVAVQAFQAQVQAYTAEWQGYGERVRAETSKVQASTEPWKAYASEVEGYKALVQAQGIMVDASARSADATASLEKTRADIYATSSRAAADQMSAQVEVFKGNVQAYSANQSAMSNYYSAQVTYAAAMMREMTAQKEMIMRMMTDNQAITMRQLEASATLSTALGNVYGHMAGAALSGMTALAASVATS